MTSQPQLADGAATPHAEEIGGRPGRALAELLAGNRRFVGGQPLHGHDVSAAATVASGDQQPQAVVVGCIDSRVPLEAIFDQTFGSMCVVRSGAHVLDQAVLGSVEFAVVALKVPLVVVLGHERCGAVTSTVQAVRSGERPGGALGYLVDQITPAVTAVGADDPQVVALATRRHVARTVATLREQVPQARFVAGPHATLWLSSLGADIVASTPEAFAEKQREDLQRWAKVIKAANVRIE